MGDNLEKVEIKRVMPTASAPAVLLGNERKTFLVFIGFAEAAALMRELKSEPADRPMTHDLIQSLFLGFDLSIRKIIVSKIVDNAFCATLILEQKITDASGDWVGKRNEVRIDARPSDCLVLALKNRTDIYVTEEVFEQVQDISHIALDETISISMEGIGESPFGDRKGDLPGPAEEEEEEDESNEDDE